jgi:nucleoside-diphosphate-sugar epimerase
VLILVTGGAGYVGSVLVPVLLAHGHRVRVLDDLQRGGHGLLQCCPHPDFSFLKGGLCDEEALAQALEGVDAVVHLAAVVGYPACDRDPDLAIETNVSGTKLLTELRRPDQRVVFASTGSVYGSLHGALCTEETPLSPISLYASTKAEAEELVLRSGNAVAFRYATAFGVSPQMRFDLLPNDFVNQAVTRGCLTVYQASFRRSFIHVRDMAESVLFALSHWASLADDVYNVGDESMNITKAELARLVRLRLEYRLAFEDFDADLDRRDYDVSYRKIRDKGFTTSVGILDGIAELVTAAQLAAAPPGAAGPRPTVARK